MASFEQGPIRPPSEAGSLLLRFTRNCPWNKCAFCPVYKRRRFSRRSLEEILEDIDAVSRMLSEMRSFARSLTGGEDLDPGVMQRILKSGDWSEQYKQLAFWVLQGEGTVFIQDANSLILKTEVLEQALTALRSKIPLVRRVTMYARSSTVVRKSEEELTRLRRAGLDRLHIGMESGSDRVLRLMNKGMSSEQHIQAGQKAVQSGFSLSEYIMPGLGGRELSREHALETARVLDAINPDFIRLRTLQIMPGTELDAMRKQGGFTPLDDDEIVSEIRLLIQSLRETTAELASDHVMNLLQEVQGRLPRDKEAMLGVIEEYLGRPREERLLYRLGRRAGSLVSPSQLDEPGTRQQLERARKSLEAQEGKDLEAIITDMGRSHL
ncbi:MAG: radical SAM protein [Desulfohalobiaceae bacterium]|nr:radical SAM protein [Desulfohalobiaceae bacterium]